MKGTGRRAACAWSVAACAAAGAAGQTTIERINLTPGGGESSGVAACAAISADGRRVLFTSPAGDLVEGDTNSAWDVFVRELPAGITRRVSVSSAGAEGDGDSGGEPGPDARTAALSTDGRWAAFISAAANLVDGETDPDGVAEVFLHDLETGETVRIPGTAGATGVTIAPSGSHVFAVADGEGKEWSRATGVTTSLPGVTGRLRSRDGGMLAQSDNNCVRVGPDGSTHYVFGPACMAPTDAKLRLVDLSDDGLHVVTKINYLLAGTLFESCVYGPLPPPSVEAPCIAGEEGGEVGEIRPVLSPSGYFYAHVDVETGRALRVFERDPAGGVWRTLEQGVNGLAPDGAFGWVDIADTGVVVCTSAAANLVAGDGNGAVDVFVVRGLASVRPVEIEIEILIDASSSVPAAGYTAMVEGVRAAIADPASFPRTGTVAVRIGVFDAAVRGGIGWTGPACPCEVGGLAALANEAGALARPASPAAACLPEVLAREGPLFEQKRWTGGRRVVLVVGPGGAGCAGPAELAAARDRALGWVDEVDAVVLDGGGTGFELYRDSVAGPAGVGFVLAGAADYSDAAARVQEAVRAILRGPGPYCRADMNGDGLVDFTDYLEMLVWQEVQDCRGDLNEDCIVDFGDLLDFLEAYDGGC